MKNIHPNRNICENKFGYRSKLEVYTNSSSDITELSDILLRARVFEKYLCLIYITNNKEGEQCLKKIS